MNNLRSIKTYFVLSLLIISASAFNTKTIDSNLAYDPSGIWDYTVVTEEGDLTGEMTIEKEDGDWQITIETDMYGTLELEDVTLD